MEPAVIAALIKMMGGAVTFSGPELIEARDLEMETVVHNDPYMLIIRIKDS